MGKNVDIEKITTCEQAENAYFNAPDKSKAEKAIFLKWNQLSMEEVEAATTCEQAENAFNNANLNSKARTAALLKWISLCKIPNEAKKAFFSVYDEHNYEAEEAALDRWNQLSMEEVEAATTRKQIEDASENAPAGSKAQHMAWIKSCKLTE